MDGEPIRVRLRNDGHEVLHVFVAIKVIDADADQRFYGKQHDTVSTRRELIEAMYPYIENMLSTTDQWLSRVTRHMHGMFSGMKGTKAWKRFLAENSFGPDANVDTLKRALEVVPDETLDASSNQTQTETTLD